MSRLASKFTVSDKTQAVHVAAIALDSVLDAGIFKVRKAIEFTGIMKAVQPTLEDAAGIGCGLLCETLHQACRVTITAIQTPGKSYAIVLFGLSSDAGAKGPGALEDQAQIKAVTGSRLRYFVAASALHLSTSGKIGVSPLAVLSRRGQAIFEAGIIPRPAGGSACHVLHA